MSDETNTSNVEKKSMFKFSFELNAYVGIAVCGLLWFGYSGHQENLKNSQKVNDLLVKYEKTLDAAIKNDSTSLRNYQKNLEKALSDLSPQEKKILEAALRLSE